MLLLDYLRKERDRITKELAAGQEAIDAPPVQDPTYEELLEAYNTATGGVPE
jgi:hypothetical protein